MSDGHILPHGFSRRPDKHPLLFREDYRPHVAESLGACLVRIALPRVRAMIEEAERDDASPSGAVTDVVGPAGDLGTGTVGEAAALR